MNSFFTLNSLSVMLRFIGLPAPRHPSICILDYEKSPVQLELPNQKVICDFYQISFKGDSQGQMKYGRQQYDYQEGSLVYLSPGQVIEYSDNNQVNAQSGWTLFFHKDLIRRFPLEQKMKSYAFFDYQSNEALHISEQEKEIIASILGKIEIELNSHIDDFSEEVIVTNLELLLNYSKRFYNRQFITRKRFDSDVVLKFQRLLTDYFEQGLQREQGLPNVAYFAGKLNYSPNYLNELIKKSTDKNILEQVHAQIVEMAKSQLLQTDKSVSEIAFDLGFDYSQYFNRFFKKKTGVTPGAYRKSG
ncbi:helix-turn-helix domain-containing protein [Sediminicola luteus]|uniref:HTH araC/xylS-type domain-containing protein n=1 Tax=Sediminicola luteus TaxID=319238 RepID=A0A2A4G7Q6_9FLAO|nr:helix-turn-helix domain-containing protein [Sediminicola luteus]PCE63785.1 hypothetical protein B7P33_10965 [Sediminicola luteus]